MVYIIIIESADKTACDLRDIEIEKRLRAGEDLEDIMNAKSHHKRQQLYEVCISISYIQVHVLYM